MINKHDIELPPNPITPMLAVLIDKASGTGTSDTVWQLMQEFASQAIEADRKRRGEPTAAEISNVVREITGCPDIKNGEKSLVDALGMLFHSYTAPQPAEPCASLMSDKTACGSENGDCDSQPDEPVKERPETTSEHIARDIREGRFPGKSERQTVPAEPVTPRTQFEDARVQKVYEIICGDNHPPFGEHWDGYVSRLIVDALFPAEPVKVPSDAELEKAWDSFEAEMARHPTDDELEEFVAQFADEVGCIHDDQHAEAARALLARYSKGAP